MTNSWPNNRDFFVVKYDSSGNVTWAKEQGGNGGDIANSIKADTYGNVFVAGNYNSTSIILDTDTMINKGAGAYDIFVIKYDSSGNINYSNSFGGTGNDFANSIAIDGNSNFYVTGSFGSDSLSFGSSILLNNYSPYVDVLTAKFDSSGNKIWATSAGGSFADGGNSIACDKNGNTIITGNFNSSAITFGTTTLVNSSTVTDFFIVKYDSVGNAIWAKGIEQATSNGVDLDYANNAFITGSFRSDSIEFGNTVIINHDTIYLEDIYLSKLNTVTGLQENQVEMNLINYFPSPFENYLTINSSTKINSIKIFSTDLKELINKKTNLSISTVVDVSSLRSGLYFLSVENEKGIQVFRKIIKM